MARASSQAPVPAMSQSTREQAKDAEHGAEAECHLERRAVQQAKRPPGQRPEHPRVHEGDQHRDRQQAQRR